MSKYEKAAQEAKLGEVAMECAQQLDRLIELQKVTVAKNISELNAYTAQLAEGVGHAHTIGFAQSYMQEIQARAVEIKITEQALFQLARAEKKAREYRCAVEGV